MGPRIGHVCGDYAGNVLEIEKGVRMTLEEAFRLQDPPRGAEAGVRYEAQVKLCAAKDEVAPLFLLELSGCNAEARAKAARGLGLVLRDAVG